MARTQRADSTSGSRGARLRRDACSSVCDGAGYAFMVGAGETYLAAFALAVGLGQLVAGLIGTIPILLGSLLQLISPWGVRTLGSLRRWVVLCASIQALSLVPLAVAAYVGHIPALPLIAFATLYWAAGLAAGPAWTTWIGSIVPTRLRTRFMAVRSRAAQLATLLGIVLAGVSLDVGKRNHFELLVFGAMFLLAAGSRGFSAWMLWRKSEAKPSRTKHRVVGFREMLSRLRHGADGRLLRYMIAVQVCLQISGPYFTPYMLAQLDFSYAEYLLVISIAFTTKVAAFPLLGRLAHRFGPQPMLWVSGFLMIPLAALWTVSDSVAFLVGVQVCSGVIWGMYELSTLLLLFDRIPEHERTSVLTFFNVANASAMVGGSLIGAAVIASLGETPAAYHMVFDVSTVARVLSVALLITVVRPQDRPRRVRIRQFFTRFLAVRPNLGTIERPILSTIDEEEPGAGK